MIDYKDLKRAASMIEHSCGPADTSVILGSGLGGFVVSSCCLRL